jgi:hypothetical protein
MLSRVETALLAGRTNSADRTRLAVDQPSTVYASFADPVITELGLDLDRQFAELLDAFDVEAGCAGDPPPVRLPSDQS